MVVLDHVQDEVQARAPGRFGNRLVKDVALYLAQPRPRVINHLGTVGVGDHGFPGRTYGDSLGTS